MKDLHLYNDINEELITHLRNLSHTMRSLYEGKGSQKRILIILLKNGSMTQHQLTQKLGIQPGSVSEVLKKIEHVGYIKRQPSANDRRTIDIHLTDQGKIQAQDALKQRLIRHQEMFSCLSTQEKETLLSLTKKINANWQEQFYDVTTKHVHHKHK